MSFSAPACAEACTCGRTTAREQRDNPRTTAGQQQDNAGTTPGPMMCMVMFDDVYVDGYVYVDDVYVDDVCVGDVYVDGFTLMSISAPACAEA